MLKGHITEPHQEWKCTRKARFPLHFVSIARKPMQISLGILCRYVKVMEMLESLNSEKYTWRLVASLYRDRLETEAKGECEEAMMLDMLVGTRSQHTSARLKPRKAKTEMPFCGNEDQACQVQTKQIGEQKVESISCAPFQESICFLCSYQGIKRPQKVVADPTPFQWF